MLVLVLLGALWGVVLVPPLLRSRTERSTDSIGDFNYRLDVLGRTNGAVSNSPRTLAARPNSFTAAPAAAGQRAAKRRRDVLTALLGAVFITMLLAYASGAQLLWAVQLIADAGLVGYLGLWAWFRSLQVERAEKVRILPQRRAPELALRRTGSS